MYIHLIFSISNGTDNDRWKENYCFPRERNHNSSVNKCTFTKVYRKKSSQGTIHTYLGKGNMSLEFSVRHQIYTLASPAVARDRCCYHTNFIAVPPSVKAIAQVDRVVTTQSQLLQPLSGLCVQRFLLLKWSICIILCFSTLSLSRRRRLERDIQSDVFLPISKNEKKGGLVNNDSLIHQGHT